MKLPQTPPRDLLSVTFIAFVCVASLSQAALADPPAPISGTVPTMHAEARMVQIEVVVTDSRGKPISDLSREDFTITDKGKLRAIDVFNAASSLTSAGSAPALSPARSLPPNVFSNRNAAPPNVVGHSTVIVLDQLNVTHDSDRTPFQTAAAQQLQVTNLMTKVPADERIAIYVMARDLGLLLLQDYTTDRELLTKRLQEYIPRGMKSKPYGPSGQSRDPNTASERETQAEVESGSRGAMLSLQALAQHLALMPGRKSVFLVRGGAGPMLMHGASGPAWDKTLTALNEANVAVNTVGEIAARTGGQTWGMRNDLDAALAEEIEAARTTYTLGFYLPENERDHEFHALAVQVNRTGAQLFYRQGYYAGETELPPSYTKAARGDLESSLLNPVDSSAVGITARVDLTQGNPRGHIDIRLNLDPATLSLKAQGADWTGKVDETFVVQNETGNTLSKVSDVKEFSVTSASRANYDRQGVAWPFSLPLLAGATKITIIIRDWQTGHVGSLTVPLR